MKNSKKAPQWWFIFLRSLYSNHYHYRIDMVYANEASFFFAYGADYFSVQNDFNPLTAGVHKKVLPKYEPLEDTN